MKKLFKKVSAILIAAIMAAIAGIIIFLPKGLTFLGF